MYILQACPLLNKMHNEMNYCYAQLGARKTWRSEKERLADEKANTDADLPTARKFRP